MAQAQVTPEEAYYVVLRTVVAGNQASWNVMSHMAQLRRLMGVSDDLHKQYLEQIKSDPEVCTINGTPLPKKPRTTPAAPAAATSKPKSSGGSKQRPSGRVSDGGFVAAAAPPPPPVPTYGLPNRKAPHEDPHGLVGKRVNIIQEDDSTVEGMVVDYNPADSTHTVLVNIGMGAEEACEPLPLVEYPDAYQDLGRHPDYIPPAGAPGSMPAPAPRPRTSYGGGAAASGGGGGGSSRPGGGSSSKPPSGAGGGSSQKSSKPKTTVRTTGGGGGGRLGQAPYNQTALDTRLAVADLQELTNMLSAISRRERAILAELEGAGIVDAELSTSVMEREELVRSLITTH